MNRYIFPLYIFSIAMLALFALLLPLETVFHVKNAIRLCYLSVVPSLFIFLVLSNLFSDAMRYFYFSGKVSYYLAKLLNVNKGLVPICLFGFIFGSPSSASAIGNIYSSGGCSKDEAKRTVFPF